MRNFRNTIPGPCYSKCGPQSSSSIVWSLLEVQNLRALPRQTESEPESLTRPQVTSQHIQV